MLLRRHVAEHGAAEPADHGGADARGDVDVVGPMRTARETWTCRRGHLRPRRGAVWPARGS
jgi:hypothetical protein